MHAVLLIVIRKKRSRRFCGIVFVMLSVIVADLQFGIT